MMQADKDHVYSLIKKYAYAKRDVVLASGEKSDVYVDCKQILFRGDVQASLARLFSNEMKLLEKEHGPFVACAGMALGAVPLCSALSMGEHLSHKRHLPALIVRKNPKGHGTQSVIEGISQVESGARLILLEDVVTSGGSSLMAAQALREAGYKVECVLALIDREAGGRNNLAKEGLSLKALFRLKDF